MVAVLYTGYKHYFMSGFPLLAMALVLWGVSCDDEKKGKVLDRFALTAGLFIITVALVYLSHTLNTYGKTAVAESKECVTALRESVSVIPEDGRDRVMVYNMDSAALSFYVVNDIKMTFDHPYLTEYHMGFDPALRERTMDFIRNEKPLWIIMPDKSGDPEVTGYIKDNYDLRKSFPMKMDIMMCQYDSDILVYRVRSER